MVNHGIPAKSGLKLEGSTATVLFENGVLHHTEDSVLERQDVNLRTTVLQRIRLEIVSGKAGPGMVLSVPTLAKALGVSTTPVREALLELVRDGLLEPIKNRGFRVLPVSAEDLNDLAAMRVRLEALAVSELKLELFGEGARLRQLAHIIANAAQIGDVQAYVTSDRAFHLELISMSGSRYLVQMIMYLRDNMRIYGLESEMGRAQQQQSVEEHFELVALLAQGNRAKAADLISRHIRGWVPVVSDNAPAMHNEPKKQD